MQKVMITKKQGELHVILIDTSVLIDYTKGTISEKTDTLDIISKNNWPFGISVYTYQEVLRGARDESEFNTLNTYLLDQRIYYLPNDASVYEKTARVYFNLRKHGIALNSPIDIFIALTATHYGLLLLHNDKDFIKMEPFMDNLQFFGDTKF